MDAMQCPRISADTKLPKHHFIAKCRDMAVRRQKSDSISADLIAVNSHLSQML
jgi:hypothetical protein